MDNKCGTCDHTFTADPEHDSPYTVTQEDGSELTLCESCFDQDYHYCVEGDAVEGAKGDCLVCGNPPPPRVACMSTYTV